MINTMDIIIVIDTMMKPIMLYYDDKHYGFIMDIIMMINTMLLLWWALLCYIMMINTMGLLWTLLW